MSRRRDRLPGRGAALTAVLTLAGCGAALPAARAAGPTSATMHASFLPDRLAASTALTLAWRFSGPPGETPGPLRTIAAHLPAGLGIGLRGASVCSPALLRHSGAGGCPRASLVGRGQAQLEVHAGSQTIPEQASMTVFRGPARAGAPTLEILAVGSTPLDERTIATALLRRDGGPYGTELAISVPAIPTLVFEPDASFDSLSLTLGGLGGKPRAHAAGAAIVTPRRCPADGFPFSADIVFAEGTSTHASTRVPCP